MKSFEKGEVLTADRLNELLAATAGAADTAGRTVPPRPGIKAQPGLARFNMQAVDACTGQVTPLPDYAGLLKGVKYDAIEEPYIERGVVHLLAGGGGGDAGITSCIFSGTVTAPTVKGTQLQLPYAEQTNEVCVGKATPVYTPGVMKHVSFAPDNCNACGYYPWIADGACYVPTPIVALGGEDGKSALCNHLIRCEYAPITLSSCKLPDGTMLYLQGWTERNGQQLRLKLTTDNAYYY